MDDLNRAGFGNSRKGPECTPLAPLPAWWSGFLFHVLNPRQVSIYVYLTMLSDDTGTCRPTIEQIREDVGLLSTTMVFDALSTLEDLGFIVRERQSFPDSRSKRNLYRRTACEFTIVRLLERRKIDGFLRPTDAVDAPASEEAKVLIEQGLRNILDGEQYERYSSATSAAKRDVLIELLEASLAQRPNGMYL